MIVTTKAANQIKQLLTKRGKGIGICIGTKKAGCNGFFYTIEYVDIEKESFTKFVINDVNIYIDAKDLPLFGDITIDYVKQGLSEGFEFINTAEVGRCGCGSSFRV